MSAFEDALKRELGTSKYDAAPPQNLADAVQRGVRRRRTTQLVAVGLGVSSAVLILLAGLTLGSHQQSRLTVGEPSPTPAMVPVCDSNQLSSTLAGSILGAGGVAYRFTLTNSGSTQCRLPGEASSVTGIDASGAKRAIQSSALEDSEAGPYVSGPPSLTLNPGGRVLAVALAGATCATRSASSFSRVQLGLVGGTSLVFVSPSNVREGAVGPFRAGCGIRLSHFFGD